jgi:DNA-binding transcriptional LysR family regulator
MIRGSRRRASVALAQRFVADEAAPMPRLDLNDIAVFVRVIELAGFAKAARELGVPTSTVSRAMARLEESLGTRLVHRNTRSVTATSEGRSFYASVSPAVTTLHHAAQGVDGADRAPRGRLRLSAPNDLGITFVASIVPAFTERYPNVAIDVELTSRKVQLVEEGFDVALRAAVKLSDSSLVARKVGDLEADLYTSPAYAQARGLPTTLAALAEHDCVPFRPKDGQAEWVLQGPEGIVRHRVRGRISGDDYNFIRVAVLGGAGIAVLPRIVAVPDVVVGRLVRVLPQYCLQGASLHILYAAAPKVPAKIAAFRDFVIEAFARVTGDPARRGWTPL